MYWTIFMPVLNEERIIDAKIKHCLNITKRVVVVEGSIPQTEDVGQNGLSTDGTTEILKSYADRIVYLPVGKCDNRIILQNHALDFIRQEFPDTEILHRTDADEFIDLKWLDEIEKCFRSGPYWLIYTDLINLVDSTRYTKNVGNSTLKHFPFCPDIFLPPGGAFHERFYRYRFDLHYEHSAHALTDSFGRIIYQHPDYYFHRMIIPNPDIKIFHYKYIDGFKRLLKAEMSYLAEDEHMIPRSDEIFNKAKLRLRNILENTSYPLKLEDHCSHMRESKYFKFEPIKYDWSITLGDVFD